MMFCHVSGRGSKAGQMIPGWPYSLVSALSPGASSWGVLLDAVRVGPQDDGTDLTAAQLRGGVERLGPGGRPPAPGPAPPGGARRSTPGPRSGAPRAPAATAPRSPPPP